MNTATLSVPATASPLALARGLRALVEQEAAETERLGTLSPRTVAAFREAGLFKMTLPVAIGGGGRGIVDLIEVVEEISYADASSGWSLMANAAATTLAYTFLGDGAIERMFGNGRMPIVAGMLGAVGQATLVDGGLRGTGRYAFGSGIGHADWVGCGMQIMENGAPRLLADGTPDARVCFMPRSQVELLGNWDVTGLVGTGSVDYQVPEQFVAHDFTFPRATLEPKRGGPLFRLGMVVIGASGHVAVVLGLMKRALHEIVEVASAKKRPGQSRVIAEGDVFKHAFALQEATYQAVRDYSIRAFQQAETQAASGAEITAETRARVRQATTWMHLQAAEVVKFCHQWSGSEAIRNATVLSRVSRDMAVATQHAYIDPQSLVDNAGPLIAAWRTQGRASA